MKQVNNTVYSESYASNIQTLTISGGLIAWDLEKGQRGYVELTSNATLSNPTNPNASYPDLIVKQDAIGGRVLSFGSDFVTPIVPLVTNTAANQYTYYCFAKRPDGKFFVTSQIYSS